MKKGGIYMKKIPFEQWALIIVAGLYVLETDPFRRIIYKFIIIWNDYHYWDCSYCYIYC